MKYRLSLLIGCLAVLLGVFTLTSCNDKDKKDSGDITFGASLIGTWKCTRTVGDSGTETITLYFKDDHTGTYKVEKANTEPEINEMRYNYDATTCIGNFLLLLEPQQSNFYMDFKLQWFGENTMVVFFKNPESTSEADYWYSVGTFERQSDGGGSSSGNVSYSVIGTWKHVETDSYNAVATMIIEFNADYTGSFIYDYNDPYNNVYIHDVYQAQYTYDATSCMGIFTRYKESETYPTRYKLIWHSENAMTVLFQDPSHPSDEWDNMGTFERQ